MKRAAGLSIDHSIETVDKLTDGQIATRVRLRLLERRAAKGRYVAIRGVPANAGAAAVKSHRRITHQPE